MMVSGKILSRISGIFHRGITPIIVKALNSIGIVDLQISTARSIKLRDKKGPFGIGSEMVIGEEPADLISFLVPPEQEQARAGSPSPRNMSHCASQGSPCEPRNACPTPGATR